jgi:hypothetical protein
MLCVDNVSSCANLTHRTTNPSLHYSALAQAEEGPPELVCHPAVVDQPGPASPVPRLHSLRRCGVVALLLCCYRMSPASLSYPALTLIAIAGPLTDAGLYQILNILCPQFGTDLHIPTLPSNEELLNKLIVEDTTGAEYLVDPAAYLHMLPNTTATANPPANTGNEATDSAVRPPTITSGTKAINALREHTASLTLTTEQISFLPLATEPMRNIFADRTLVRQHDLKQVYVVYGGRKYTVTLADFYAQGYEFSDVVGITAWEMGLLPEGGAFNPSVINS